MDTIVDIVGTGRAPAWDSYVKFWRQDQVEARFGRVNDLGEQVVLVADDEHTIVDLLSDLLRDEGYSVIQAFDGIMALEEINRADPDLIIADVMMPRLDGLSLLKMVEAKGKSIPFILMSAAVIPRSTTATFVPKPFDIDTMLNVVHGAMAK